MTVLYKAELKSGLNSYVREGAGTGYGIVRPIVGPVTVEITGEGTVNQGYYWYPISSPVAGWIALTDRYEDFRAVETTPDTEHVKITIERTGYEPLILEGDQKKV